MAITLRSVGEVVSGFVQSLEVPPAAGIQDNDLLIIASTYKETGGNLTVAEAGWTDDTQIESEGPSRSLTVSYKKALSESGNYTVDSNEGTSRNMIAVCIALAGVDQTTPIDAASTTVLSISNSTTHDPAAITTVTLNAWVFSIMAHTQGDDGLATQPSGYTSDANNGGTNIGLGVAHIADLSIGSEDPGVWSALGTSADSLSITLAIRPASVVDSDVLAQLQLAVTVAADLDAEGALSAAQLLALTVAADLDAQGKTQAAVSLILAVVAELRASGNLQAANTLQLSVLADLDGIGSLSVAASLALTTAADLDAQGMLSAATSILVTVTASIGGAVNDLAAATQLALDIAANLTAQGKTEAALAISITVTAAVTSATNNDMTANPSISLTVTPDLAASGKLEAANSLSVSVLAGLTGSGAIKATPTLTMSAIADLDAQGQVAAVLPIALAVAADVKASGELAAAAQIILSVLVGITDANATKVFNLVARDVAFQVAIRTLVEFAEKNAYKAKFSEVEVRDVYF